MFLSSVAYAADAAAAPAQQGSALSMFFPLIVFVLIFYFFIMRPQKKRQKSHDQLIGSLTRGDKIITAGGFFGIIRDVKEDSVIIEIAEGTKARVLKGSITTKITPEAPKTEPVKEEVKSKVDASPSEKVESTPEVTPITEEIKVVAPAPADEKSQSEAADIKENSK